MGGVAGGATAAARARRVNANAEIIILERGPAVSFANCGLPYHLGGEIEDRNKLLVATKELFWDRFRIKVYTHHNAQLINREKQTVSGLDANNVRFEMPYDKLILATGSEPVRPEFCNMSVSNLFQLWTLTDMDNIIARMKQHPCKRATVIGAGFVGLEVVEQLHRRGLQVTLLEKLPQVLGPLDSEMAKLVQLELQNHNIDLHLSASVSKLSTSEGQVTEIQLADGQTIPTDLVIVGTGVRPRTELAVSAGLSIGKTGGVAVNEYCQTSDANIYAVGDMIEYFHGTLGQNMRVPLAGPANRSGRVAGSHAAVGHSAPLPPVQGTAIVRIFNLTAGLTGLSERNCRAHNIDYRCATIQAPHHASYFPGAKNLTVKLIYAPDDGRVLGVQAVGPEGIDKRLDVVATLLQFEGTVDDLAGLDLSYAPPFGSAKDPIHMAAFVAQNDLSDYPTLAAVDTDLHGIQVVDVRTASELENLPLAGAVHIPIDELVTRWESLDPSKPTIVVCHSGKRAHVAACWLKGKGFQNVRNLNGGMSIRKLY